MKQRLALAIALIGQPQVLILDEVTASLDSIGRDQFVSLLLSLAKGTDRCVLFASHRVEEIDAMANRVIRLEQGKIIADEPVNDFVRRMQRPDDVLHLSIEPPMRQRAIDLLGEQGFAARMNGCGLLVSVDASRRMRPVRTLAEHRIEVQAIDWVTADANRGHV
jgi:ABC-type multidrug transport system ATPase subunit